MDHYDDNTTAPGGQAEALGRHMLYVGDCLDLIRALPDNSVDAVVTDPPYGLEFMGKAFDTLGNGPAQQAWHLAWLTECLRVLKPGGHLVAFGGTRTYHRLACAAEDAGFEIRDSLQWLYGSGFPKSHNVGKSIDKAAGAVREVVGQAVTGTMNSKPGATVNADGAFATGQTLVDITAPATPEAAQWEGWGTALKPAVEPIALARKPLTGTVAANVLRYGTGAINVDGCRVACDAGEVVEDNGVRVDLERASIHAGYDRPNATMFRTGKPQHRGGPAVEAGRWPPNVLLDGEAAAMLDASAVGEPARYYPQFAFDDVEATTLRFCYSAKTSKAARGEGNTHPTVKPIALMRWLARLVTPPGGTILEPFGGSGTTILAGEREGFTVIAAEKSPEYAAMIRLRWTGRAAVFASQDRQAKKPKGA